MLNAFQNCEKVSFIARRTIFSFAAVAVDLVASVSRLAVVLVEAEAITRLWLTFEHRWSLEMKHCLKHHAYIYEPRPVPSLQFQFK